MSMGRQTVLIADDSLINRTFLAKALEEEYDILSACDGEDVFKVLAAHPGCVSAILLDIMMPNLDGYQVLERLQADEALKSIPVVVVTSESEHSSELRALDLGASDYLTKPIDPEIARRRTKTVIEGREVERLRYENRLLDELKFRAYHDDLTGIYSRAALIREIPLLLDDDPTTEFMLIR